MGHQPSQPNTYTLCLPSFGPPRYRSQEGINLPFKVIPIVNEQGRTRMEANVTVKAQFSSKMHALNVVVLVSQDHLHLLLKREGGGQAESAGGCRREAVASVCL